jgi:hypothetical protein
MKPPKIHPDHLADLRRSGLSDKTIGAAGIYTVPPDEIGKKLGGGDYGIESLLAFPYPGCDGYKRFKVWYGEGQEKDSKGKQRPKYRQPKDAPNRLYIPPETDMAGDSPFLLTEGEKKTLALRQAGYQMVGVSGIWNWCAKGKGYRKPKDSRPISDLDLVNWHRSVIILFDSDGQENRMVRLAAFRLARELARRGAAVSILFLPAGPNGEKVGADDYLVAHGPEAFRKLLETAWSFDPAWKDAEAEIAWQTKDLGPETPLPEKLKTLALVGPILARMSNAEEEAALAELQERLGLKNSHLRGVRKDINQTRKAKAKKIKTDDGEAVYSVMLPDLVDLVEFEGEPAFLLLTGNGVSIVPEWEHEGVFYIPPPREQIPWPLPRGEQVKKWYDLKESPATLYEDLRAYHRGISELPDEGYYHLLVAWDFHTYLSEAAHYSPEICLFAVPERGKTRTGKALIYVCRRGVHVESLRDAFLVRLAHNFQATIFFDVMNLWKKAEKTGTEDIILGRFERGIKVPRVLYPERGAYRDTVYYDIFGPTIIATNVPVHNILDTRSVQINLPQARARRFETDVTPEAALPFKERLTAFRARFMGKPLPECQKPASGRLGDILKPLLQIIKLVKPSAEPPFMALVRDIGKDRLIDKIDGIEAQILLTLNSLKGRVEKGIIGVKAITDTFNDGKPESAQITYQRMGRKLKALSFRKAKTGDGASAIEWDEEKFARIFSAYGLEQTSEIPETSETPDETTDVSDVCSPACEEKNSSLFYDGNITRVVI